VTLYERTVRVLVSSEICLSTRARLVVGETLPWLKNHEFRRIEHASRAGVCALSVWFDANTVHRPRTAVDLKLGSGPLVAFSVRRTYCDTAIATQTR
jgi:hypothetical protein